MMSMKLYSAIAQTCEWMRNLAKADAKMQQEWMPIAQRRLDSLEKILPSGSGIYNTTIISDKTSYMRIEINFMYQHMDDGYYTGSSGYRTIIKPSLAFGYTLSIFGNNKNQEKDYLSECFCDALDSEVIINEDGDAFILV